MKTDIDFLYDILKPDKFTSIKDISKMLKLKEDRIISWLSTLEEKGLVEIKYPFFRSVKVKKITYV